MKLTQYRKSCEEILEKLEQIAAFPDNSPEAVEQRKKSCEKDVFLFAKTYLPHYCNSADFPLFYKEVDGQFRKKTNIPNPICFAAPRGFAKSVYAFFRIIHAVCYKMQNFIIYVSASDDLAADFVDFIRLELADNERIKQDFNLPFRLGKKSNITANGVRIFSRSKRQMVRGFRFRNHRPDLIIIDDIEKDEDASSPVIVEKTLKVITKGLYPSLKPNGGSKLVIFGTIIKKRSVLGTILYGEEKPYDTWWRRVYNAVMIDKNGKEFSLWESRFPLKSLYQIRETIGTVSFHSEYQNTPTDDDDNMFQESWVQYFKLSEVDINSLVKVTFIDPSAKNKKKNDLKAIITVGLDKSTMKYYLLNAWIKRTTISNMLHATFRIYRNFRPHIVGIESNGFQELLGDLYEEMEKHYGINLPLRLVHHHQPKEIRVMAMQPLLERKKFFFCSDGEDDMKILMNQLLFYPDSKVNDDGPDAMAEAINICTSFSSGGRSKFASSTRGKRESVKLLTNYHS